MEEEALHERKWYLAAKKLTGDLAQEEEAEWATFNEDAQFREEFARMKAHWQRAGTLPYGQIDARQDWPNVWEKARLQTAEPGKRVLVPWLNYAAAVAAFLLLSWLVWQGGRRGWFANHPPTLSTIEAPAGSQTVVTLPDRSKIWLNAGSKISYDNGFGTENRRIVLEGEAFFDVVKKKLPFTVHTAQYDIAVLGTAFNVRAYREDEQATTTLVRGSLKVERTNAAGKHEEVLLKPHDRLVWRKAPVQAPDSSAAPKTGAAEQALTVERGVNTESETDWKDGWLSVRGESLDELARKIERRYDVRIRFQDEALKTYRYTGRIRQLSLEQVFKVLSLTSPVEFTIREKTVTLRENQSTKSKYRSLQTP